MNEEQENKTPLPVHTHNSGAWGLCMIISLLFSLATGVALIWISIARNDLGYEIFKLQKEIDNGSAHITKLDGKGPGINEDARSKKQKNYCDMSSQCRQSLR